MIEAQGVQVLGKGRHTHALYPHGDVHYRVEEQPEKPMWDPHLAFRGLRERNAFIEPAHALSKHEGPRE